MEAYTPAYTWTDGTTSKTASSLLCNPLTLSPLSRLYTRIAVSATGSVEKHPPMSQQGHQSCSLVFSLVLRDSCVALYYDLYFYLHNSWSVICFRICQVNSKKVDQAFCAIP